MNKPRKTSSTPSSRFGETTVTILGDRAPALPHERDTSSHSQHGEPTPEVKQAYKDVQRGIPDADVGAPMDTLYHDEFRHPQGKQRSGKTKQDGKKPASPGRAAR